jgi:hypothetical protein
MSVIKSTISIDRESIQKDKVQLHYAVKLLALVSALLRKSAPDYSHTALQWDDKLGFTTQTIATSGVLQPFRIAVDPILLNLSLLVDDQYLKSFSLGDRSLSEAYDWLRTVLTELGIPVETLAKLTYVPSDEGDELARGETFTSQKLTSNLTDYYAISSKVLQDIVRQEPNASPVRLWAHHFDIATLISYPSEQNESGEGKSIGVGLSPSDSSYDEPYWYVTPYPYPEDKTNLPELAGNGFWHTEEWVGAVLTASQFGEPKSSSEEIRVFIDSAIAACKKLLN